MVTRAAVRIGGVALIFGTSLAHVNCPATRLDRRRLTPVRPLRLFGVLELVGRMNQAVCRAAFRRSVAVD